MKYLLVIAGIIIFCSSKGQNPLQISISNTTSAATDSLLPFWFVANEHGKVNAANPFSNITDLKLGQSHNKKAISGFSYSWGSNVIAAFGKTNDYQLNQAFAALAFKGWEIKGGLFYDETRYAGLSTSNGIIGRSRNSRPYPAIRLSTLGYKTIPLFKNRFSIKAEYDEGWLNDERYVDGTHLHHKSAYLKIKAAQSWDICIGFEHFAMWGGTSRDEKVGEMPGWENYWRYVFALPGNEDFPLNDRLNISGNQLGSYQIEVIKDLPEMTISFYLSHPWEDNSGLNWHNWPDNLLGIHVDLKDKKNLLTDIVYEFTNTRQQSVKDPIYQGPDNYFNHGIYRSGFTYRQQVMSSPLFFPVIVEDDISMGIQSNRFFAHHLGLRGNFSEQFRWKGLFTYIQHLGTYGQPYNPVQKQVSAIIEVQYVNPGFPVELGIATGADTGNTIANNFGIQFTVAKRW